MISFDDARARALDCAEPLPAERVLIDACCKRVLAEPIVAREPSPLFDNSAVDGYGVRVDDVAAASRSQPVELPVTHTIQAGADAGAIDLPPGTAVKIMTGAVAPATVEAVIMREQVGEHPAHIRVTSPVTPGQNIRRRGEEFAAGARLLDPGTRISPAIVGLLATTGYSRVKVARVPRVTLVVTGNEIRHPAEELAPGQIRDSNSYALSAALAHHGITAEVHRVSDDRDVLSGTLAAALDRADVVITVGGVSVGDYDFVRDVLAALHVETVYWGVAMKPGKPNYLGRARGLDERPVLVFGLPGNPVSAMVSFYVLVAPALRRMSGLVHHGAAAWPARLGRDMRMRGGREEFLRGMAVLDDGQWIVEPLVGQGSHMMAALAQANCLIRVPPDVEDLAIGTAVEVWWLGGDWASVR